MIHEIHKKTQKVVAAVTLLSFTLSSVSWSAPISTSINISNYSDSNEVAIKSIVRDLEIPESLGSVKERFTAPGPNVFHLQDAHGSPEAQESIRQIIHHISKEHKIDAILLEGAIGRIDPDLLRYFDSEKQNQELAGKLTEAGIVDGAELYLLDISHKGKAPNVMAHGIENKELYENTLEAYRSVYENRLISKRFSEQLKLEITSKASQLFNRKLGAFFRDWLFYQDVPNQFLSHLDSLKVYSKNELGIDLSDARQQRDWPQIVRILKLQELQSQIHETQMNQEFSKLLTWLEASKMDQKYAAGFNAWKNHQKLSGGDLRSFLEKFYDAAVKRGFSYQNYPELSKSLGMSVIQEELNAGDLFDEVELLTDKILEHLASTTKEKALVNLYKDYSLIRNLLSLELTQVEYGKIQVAEARLNPTIFMNRIDRIRSQKRSAGFKKWKSKTAELNGIFRKSLEFYELASAREEVMFKNLVRMTKDSRADNILLVTGGFHENGLHKLFRETGISYAEIIPRMSQISDSETYSKIMMMDSSVTAKHSTANNPVASDVDLAAAYKTYYQDQTRQIAHDMTVTTPKGTVVMDVKTVESQGPRAKVSRKLTTKRAETRQTSLEPRVDELEIRQVMHGAEPGLDLFEHPPFVGFDEAMGSWIAGLETNQPAQVKTVQTQTSATLTPAAIDQSMSRDYLSKVFPVPGKSTSEGIASALVQPFKDIFGEANVEFEITSQGSFHEFPGGTIDGSSPVGRMWITKPDGSVWNADFGVVVHWNETHTDLVSFSLEYQYRSFDLQLVTFSIRNEYDVVNGETIHTGITRSTRSLGEEERALEPIIVNKETFKVADESEAEISNRLQTWIHDIANLPLENTFMQIATVQRWLDGIPGVEVVSTEVGSQGIEISVGGVQHFLSFRRSFQVGVFGGHVVSLEMTDMTTNLTTVVELGQMPDLFNGGKIYDSIVLAFPATPEETEDWVKETLDVRHAFPEVQRAYLREAMQQMLGLKPRGVDGIKQTVLNQFDTTIMEKLLFSLSLFPDGTQISPKSDWEVSALLRSNSFTPRTELGGVFEPYESIRVLIPVTINNVRAWIQTEMNVATGKIALIQFTRDKVGGPRVGIRFDRNQIVAGDTPVFTDIRRNLSDFNNEAEIKAFVGSLWTMIQEGKPLLSLIYRHVIKTGPNGIVTLAADLISKASDDGLITPDVFENVTRMLDEGFRDLRPDIVERIVAHTKSNILRLILTGEPVIGNLPELPPGYEFDPNVLGATYTPEAGQLLGILFVRVLEATTKNALPYLTHATIHEFFGHVVDFIGFTEEMTIPIYVQGLISVIFKGLYHGAYASAAPWEWWAELSTKILNGATPNKNPNDPYTVQQLFRYDPQSLELLSPLVRNSVRWDHPGLNTDFDRAEDMKRMLEVALSEDADENKIRDVKIEILEHHDRVDISGVTSGRFSVSVPGYDSDVWTVTSRPVLSDAGVDMGYEMELVNSAGVRVAVYKGYVGEVGKRVWIFKVDGQTDADVFKWKTDSMRSAGFGDILIGSLLRSVGSTPVEPSPKNPLQTLTIVLFPDSKKAVVIPIQWPAGVVQTHQAPSNFSFAALEQLTKANPGERSRKLRAGAVDILELLLLDYLNSNLNLNISLEELQSAKIKVLPTEHAIEVQAKNKTFKIKIEDLHKSANAKRAETRQKQHLLNELFTQLSRGGIDLTEQPSEVSAEAARPNAKKPGTVFSTGNMVRAFSAPIETIIAFVTRGIKKRNEADSLGVHEQLPAVQMLSIDSLVDQPIQQRHVAPIPALVSVEPASSTNVITGPETPVQTSELPDRLKEIIQTHGLNLISNSGLQGVTFGEAEILEDFAGRFYIDKARLKVPVSIQGESEPHMIEINISLSRIDNGSAQYENPAPIAHIIFKDLKTGTQVQARIATDENLPKSSKLYFSTPLRLAIDAQDFSPERQNLYLKALTANLLNQEAAMQQILVQDSVPLFEQGREQLGFLFVGGLPSISDSAWHITAFENDMKQWSNLRLSTTKNLNGKNILVTIDVDPIEGKLMRAAVSLEQNPSTSIEVSGPHLRALTNNVIVFSEPHQSDVATKELMLQMFSQLVRDDGKFLYRFTYPNESRIPFIVNGHELGFMTVVAGPHVPETIFHVATGALTSAVGNLTADVVSNLADFSREHPIRYIVGSWNPGGLLGPRYSGRIPELIGSNYSNEALETVEEVLGGISFGGAVGITFSPGESREGVLVALWRGGEEIQPDTPHQKDVFFREFTHTLVHEFGHFVYYFGLNASDRNVFDASLQTDLATGVFEGRYANTNMWETFAEDFASVMDAPMYDTFLSGSRADFFTVSASIGSSTPNLFFHYVIDSSTGQPVQNLTADISTVDELKGLIETSLKMTHPNDQVTVTTVSGNDRVHNFAVTAATFKISINGKETEVEAVSRFHYENGNEGYTLQIRRTDVTDVARFLYVNSGVRYVNAGQVESYNEIISNGKTLRISNDLERLRAFGQALEETFSPKPVEPPVVTPPVEPPVVTPPVVIPPVVVNPSLPANAKRIPGNPNFYYTINQNKSITVYQVNPGTTQVVAQKKTFETAGTIRKVNAAPNSLIALVGNRAFRIDLNHLNHKAEEMPIRISQTFNRGRKTISIDLENQTATVTDGRGIRAVRRSYRDVSVGSSIPSGYQQIGSYTNSNKTPSVVFGHLVTAPKPARPSRKQQVGFQSLEEKLALAGPSAILIPPTLVHREVSTVEVQPKTPTVTQPVQVSAPKTPLNPKGVDQALVSAVDRSIEELSVAASLPTRSQSVTDSFFSGQAENPQPVKGSALSTPVVRQIPASTTGKFNVEFSAVQRAVIYQVQVATSPNFSAATIVHEGFPQGTQEAVTVTKSGNYYVRVRASANASVETGPVSQWSEAVVAKVSLPVLSAPVVRQIPGNAGKFNVEFSGVQGAAIYQVQVATASDFNPNSIVHEGFPQNTLEPVTVTKSGTYYVRVRASANLSVETGPVSQWSEVVTTKSTIPALSVPVVRQIPASTTGKFNVEFSAVQRAVIYQVQVATSPNFSAATIVHEGFPQGTQEAVTVAQSGNYYVRVRASANTSVETGPVSQWSEVVVAKVDLVQRPTEPVPPTKPTQPPTRPEPPTNPIPVPPTQPEPPVPTKPITIIVTSNESIQAAIDRARSGDAIRIHPRAQGAQLELLDLKGKINLTLEGITDNGIRPVISFQRPGIPHQATSLPAGTVLRNLDINSLIQIGDFNLQQGADNIVIENVKSQPGIYGLGNNIKITGSQIGFMDLDGNNNNISDNRLGITHIGGSNNVLSKNIIHRTGPQPIYDRSDSSKIIGYANAPVLTIAGPRTSPSASFDNLIIHNTVVGYGNGSEFNILNLESQPAIGIWFLSQGRLDSGNRVIDTIVSNTGKDIDVPNNTKITVSYSLLQFPVSSSKIVQGPGVIIGNPLFVNLAAEDFRFQTGSPAIGTASDRTNMGAVQEVIKATPTAPTPIQPPTKPIEPTQPTQPPTTKPTEPTQPPTTGPTKPTQPTQPPVVPIKPVPVNPTPTKPVLQTAPVTAAVRAVANEIAVTVAGTFEAIQAADLAGPISASGIVTNESVAAPVVSTAVPVTKSAEEAIFFAIPRLSGEFARVTTANHQAGIIFTSHGLGTRQGISITYTAAVFNLTDDQRDDVELEGVGLYSTLNGVGNHIHDSLNFTFTTNTHTLTGEAGSPLLIAGSKPLAPSSILTYQVIHENDHNIIVITNHDANYVYRIDVGTNTVENVNLSYAGFAVVELTNGQSDRTDVIFQSFFSNPAVGLPPPTVFSFAGPLGQTVEGIGAFQSEGIFNVVIDQNSADTLTAVFSSALVSPNQLLTQSHQIDEAQQKRMRALDNLDINKDHQLTAAEVIPVLKQILENLGKPVTVATKPFDLDNNGVITPTDFGVHLNVVNEFLSPAEQKRFAAFRNLDTNGDLILTAAEVIKGLNQIAEGLGKPVTPDNAKFDLDNNGVLNPTDFGIHQNIANEVLSPAEQKRMQAYGNLNVNGDHVLTAVEVINGLTQILQGLGKPVTPQNAKFDLDNNGVLTPTDFVVHLNIANEVLSPAEQKRLRAFENLDTNRDRKLTAVEVIPVLSKIIENIGKPVTQETKKFDLDNNGVITPTDFGIHLNLANELLSAAEQKRMRAFENLDTNKDRVLTAAEVAPVLKQIIANIGKPVTEATKKFALENGRVITPVDFGIHQNVAYALLSPAEQKLLQSSTNQPVSTSTQPVPTSVQPVRTANIVQVSNKTTETTSKINQAEKTAEVISPKGTQRFENVQILPSGQKPAENLKPIVQYKSQTGQVVTAWGQLKQANIVQVNNKAAGTATRIDQARAIAQVASPSGVQRYNQVRILPVKENPNDQSLVRITSYKSQNGQDVAVWGKVTQPQRQSERTRKPIGSNRPQPTFEALRTVREIQKIRESLEADVKKANARSELRHYLNDFEGVTVQAVAKTAQISANTIRRDYPRSIFEALLELVVPEIAKVASVDMNQEELRARITEKADFLSHMVGDKRLPVAANAVFVGTTEAKNGDLNKRVALILAAIPIIAALAEKDAKSLRGSFIFGGQNAAKLKSAIYRKNNGLTSAEKNMASKIIQFPSSEHLSKLADMIQTRVNTEKKSLNPRSVVSLATQVETGEISNDIFRQILNAIDNVDELKGMNLTPDELSDAAEAYVFRALHLMNLAKLLRLKGDKLKDQPDLIQKYILQYFDENMPEAKIQVKNGSIVLSLAEVSKYLTTLKHAEAQMRSAA